MPKVKHFVSEVELKVDETFTVHLSDGRAVVIQDSNYDLWSPEQYVETKNF